VSTIKEVLAQSLHGLVSPRSAQSILATLPREADAAVGSLDLVATQSLVRWMESGLRLFGSGAPPSLLQSLRRRCSGDLPASPSIVEVPVSSDVDVLAVQSKCQAMCKEFFGATDCVRLATAASELARNIYMYAKTGKVLLELCEDGEGVRFSVTASDRGPGIANVEAVLAGTYVSRTGLGRGLAGTRKLLDHLEVESTPGQGTVVRGWKRARGGR
jgi:serine/threonine-protein kinase RsbT